MKTLLTSILALSFSLTAPAFAEVSAIKPRAAVEKIAAVIQTQFYDEARAGQIARDLRAEAGLGAYDRLTNPNDFATTLTTRLSPLDGHFRVSWAPPGTGWGRRRRRRLCRSFAPQQLWLPPRRSDARQRRLCGDKRIRRLRARR